MEYLEGRYVHRRPPAFAGEVSAPLQRGAAPPAQCAAWVNWAGPGERAESAILGRKIRAGCGLYDAYQPQARYEDYFYGDGFTIVEWADLIPELLPERYLKIKIEKDPEKGFDYRRITVEDKVQSGAGDGERL